MLALACIAAAVSPAAIRAAAGDPVQPRSFGIVHNPVDNNGQRIEGMYTFPREIRKVSPYERKNWFASQWENAAVYLGLESTRGSATPDWEMYRKDSENYYLNNIALRAGDKLYVYYYDEKEHYLDENRYPGMTYTVPGEVTESQWGKAYNVTLDPKNGNEGAFTLELVSGLPPFVALELHDWGQPHPVRPGDDTFYSGVLGWMLYSNKGQLMRGFDDYDLTVNQGNVWIPVTRWPVEYPVYFTGEHVAHMEGNRLVSELTDKALSSEQITFRPEGEPDVAAAFQALDGHQGLQLNGSQTYSRYTIRRVWLSGKANIFTGWGVEFENDGITPDYGRHAHFGLSEAATLSASTPMELNGQAPFDFGSELRYVDLLELYIPVEMRDGMWHAIDGRAPILFEPTTTAMATLRASKSSTKDSQFGNSLTDLTPTFNSGAFPEGYSLQSYEINQEQLRYSEVPNPTPLLLSNHFKKVQARTTETPHLVTAPEERIGNSGYGGYLIYRMDYTLVNAEGKTLDYASWSNPVYIERNPMFVPSMAPQISVSGSGYTPAKLFSELKMLPLRGQPQFDFNVDVPFADKAAAIRLTSGEYPEATWTTSNSHNIRYFVAPDVIALGEWVDEVKAAFGPDVPYNTADTDLAMTNMYNESKGDEWVKDRHNLTDVGGRTGRNANYMEWRPEMENFIRVCNHMVTDNEFRIQSGTFPGARLPGHEDTEIGEFLRFNYKSNFTQLSASDLSFEYNAEESREARTFTDGVETVDVTLDNDEVLTLNTSAAKLRSLSIDVTFKKPAGHLTFLQKYDIVYHFDVLGRDGEPIGQGFDFIDTRHTQYIDEYHFRLSGLDPRPEMNPTVHLSVYFLDPDDHTKRIVVPADMTQHYINLSHYLPNAYTLRGTGSADASITRFITPQGDSYSLMYDSMTSLSYTGDVIHDPATRVNAKVESNLNPGYWHIEASQGNDAHQSLPEVYDYSHAADYASAQIAEGFDTSLKDLEQITITPIYLFERDINMTSMNSYAVPYNPTTDAIGAPQRAKAAAADIEIVALRGNPLPLKVTNEVMLEGGNPTGLDGLTVDGAAPIFYNLQGVRVERPEAGGIYIVVRDNGTTKELVR